MTLEHILGFFFHGLAYFALSLSMFFLQYMTYLQYQSYRIIMSRRLSWLGVFGLCEAVVAWDGLFASMTASGVFLPSFIRPAILGWGYAFLVVFSVQTFRPDADLPIHPQRLLIIMQSFWFVLYLLILNIIPDIDQAIMSAESLFRYTMAVPGGILAAFGLRSESYQTLKKKMRDRVRPYLRLVEGTMGVFGLLNLILVPQAPFFPASIINQTWLPFHSSWVWAIIGISITLGLTLALVTVQSEIESWVESTERIQALTLDRERISRDLHDSTIQSIYAAGLLLEGVKQIIPSDPERAQAQLARIMDSLNTIIKDLRQYIFDLRSDMPNDDIKSGISRLLRDFQTNTLLETSLNISDESILHDLAPNDFAHTLSMERRRHILQIVREALTNTARHAQARSVEIDLVYGPEALTLTISDDGVGMESLHVSKGHGMRNIRERAKLLDGTLKIESAPGEGVTYRLTVPY
jgi:signal transduction histidine kinase